MFWLVVWQQDPLSQRLGSVLGPGLDLPCPSTGVPAAYLEEEGVGRSAIPMCPPAPSLGHSSSKDEGSQSRAVSILRAPWRCPSVCSQCRSQARSLLSTGAISVCRAPRRMTTKEAASVSWMGKLRLRVTEPGARSLHLSPTPSTFCLLTMNLGASCEGPLQGPPPPLRRGEGGGDRVGG